MSNNVYLVCISVQNCLGKGLIDTIALRSIFQSTRFVTGLFRSSKPGRTSSEDVNQLTWNKKLQCTCCVMLSILPILKLLCMTKFVLFIIKFPKATINWLKLWCISHLRPDFSSFVEGGGSPCTNCTGCSVVYLCCMDSAQ